MRVFCLYFYFVGITITFGLFHRQQSVVHLDPAYTLSMVPPPGQPCATMVTVLFLRSLNEITPKSLNMVLTEHPKEKRCLKPK